MAVIYRIVKEIILPLRTLVKAIFYNLKHSKRKVYISVSSEVYNCSFAESIRIFSGCILKNVQIGRFSYVSTNVRCVNSQIGSFCSIGPNVIIAPGSHPTDRFSASPFFYSKNAQEFFGIYFVHAGEGNYCESKPVIIEDDVWIGANVVIMDGVKIGKGAIIGAGAIVTKDVLPYNIVGGVPAKFIRERKHSNIEWFRKDLKWIEDNYKHLTL